MIQQEHISVFYEGQDDFVDVLATSMVSICYNTKSFIDFYILDCGVCDFNKNLLESLKENFDNFSLEFIPIDLKQFEGLKGYTAKNFVDCYSRLLIPELKPELNKAIYLDADVIALKDVVELWNEDIENTPILGVMDIAYSNSVWVKEVMTLSSNKFINSGVLLINCTYWRNYNCSSEIISLAKKYKNFLGAICEDLLSAYFENKFKILNFRYGYSSLPSNDSLAEVSENYIRDGKKNTVFVHFSGETKPWLSPENAIVWGNNIKIFMWSSFWFFAKMTPYYEGLSLKFLNNSNKNILGLIVSILSKYPQKYNIRLFGFIPFLTVKRSLKKLSIKLFGFIPILKIKKKGEI